MLRTRPVSRVALALAPLGFAFALLLLPSLAHAQYKNTSFGFDVGAWLITKPSLLDDDGNIRSVNNRPIRLANGLRIGGEVDTKLSEDHWWFAARANLGLLRYNGSENGSVTEQFDAAANDQLGTILGAQAQLGVKYVIFTDRIRPYIGSYLSYMHLFSFTSASGDTCANGLYGICDGANTFGNEFLPRTNVFGFHIEPGIEFIFTRDIAFKLSADMQRWIVFNADDNSSITIALGFVFFT
jgi:hypothetical protein